MQGFIDYVQRIWGGALPGQLARAILVAALFELLVYLVNRWISARLGPVLRRDARREPSERVRRRRIVGDIPLLLSRAVFYVIALLIILRIFGFPTHAELLPVLGGVAVIALVVGGRPLRDAVRGYLIAYDDLYSPGDRVSIGEVSGTVTEMSLRATRLRTRDGGEVVIPNSQVDRVINHSRTGASGSEEDAQARGSGRQ